MKLINRQLFVFLFCLALPSMLIAQDLRAIGQLARDGAPGLALELLSQIQPKAEENFDGWLFFEQQRIEILRDWDMWEPLLKRLQEFPLAAPTDLQRWAKVEMVNAELQLGRGENARAHLRALLWQPPELLEQKEFSLYRRLVVRSYLVDNKLQDARRAIQRYEQDFGNKGDDWIKLKARVLLRIDRAAEAESLFSSDTSLDHEAQALKLLARLRADKQPPQSILGEARKLAGSKGVAKADSARLWKVAAESAAALHSNLTLTKALEEAALLSPRLGNDPLFAVSGNELWAAYSQYALDEGNSMQFLIGQDERWLAEAEKWKDTRSQRERAFLTVVMFNGATMVARGKAYDRFLISIQKRDATVILLSKLFLDSSRFPIAGTIPNSVRYILVDDALAKNNIELATRLMSGLEQAPEDTDAFEWGLRRARVLILGGRADEGISVLNKLIDGMENTDKKAVDRTTQVVFDLQTVGQHKEAILLFDKLDKLTVDPQLKRELLFWQADSYKAIGGWPRAAQLYLLSATLVDGKGYDLWGQTARFRAAEVLAEAAVIDDARRLYEGLLKVTREPSRRAAIRYKLQELWLREPARQAVKQ
ncbi:MAG: hypothetical protein JXA04_07890 [Gammaproteobacteria bacterium]|nr:hypothetical protein [Gammaproteobacteria bacterium]